MEYEFIVTIKVSDPLTTSEVEELREAIEDAVWAVDYIVAFGLEEHGVELVK